MLLPNWHLLLSCLDHPFNTFLGKVFRMGTTCIAHQDVETSSCQSSSIDVGLKESMSLESIGSSTQVLFNNFSFVSKRNVSPTSINMRISCKDGMHISSCSSFRASLKRLRERVFFVSFSKHISIFVTQYLSRINTTKCEVRVSVNVGKEILSSPGMFECIGEKIVKLFIVSVEGVNIVVIVVFETMPLIGFRREVLTFFFDGLEFGNVLFVL